MNPLTLIKGVSPIVMLIVYLGIGTALFGAWKLYWHIYDEDLRDEGRTEIINEVKEQADESRTRRLQNETDIRGLDDWNLCIELGGAVECGLQPQGHPADR